MKKIRPFGLAMTFAGCFLGAGYVSGQELWQFFGSFGKSGIWGILLAMLGMFVFGVMLIGLARKTKITAMDAVVVPWDVPWLKAAVGIVEAVFLFCVFIIMAAGTASLAEEMLGVPRALGGAIFCALVAAVSLCGVEGMIRVFSWAVPVLVGCTVLIGGYIVLKNGIAALPAPQEVKNPLLSNWVISAGTYVAYNIFGSIGILTPLGLRTPNRRTLLRGVAIGTGMLLLIAGAILAALWAVPSAAEAALPMLALASEIHAAVGYLYAFLLFTGMFGAALSVMVAMDEYCRQRVRVYRKKRLPCVILLSVLAWAGSLFGFSELIGTVYPVFGYFGIAALCCIALHCVRKSRK